MENSFLSLSFSFPVCIRYVICVYHGTGRAHIAPNQWAVKGNGFIDFVSRRFRCCESDGSCTHYYILFRFSQFSQHYSKQERRESFPASMHLFSRADENLQLGIGGEIDHERRTKQHQTLHHLYLCLVEPIFIESKRTAQNSYSPRQQMSCTTEDGEGKLVISMCCFIREKGQREREGIQGWYNRVSNEFYLKLFCSHITLMIAVYICSTSPMRR